MDSATITIEKRFAGPPASANGGYASGRIASFIEGPAEITLRMPPPLDTPLQLTVGAGNEVDLRHGDDLIATGKPAEFAIGNMHVPSFDEATLAASRTFPVSRHPLPRCFVCGPDRELGDGLRIHPGPVDPDDHDWQGVVAASWIPDANLADESGVVRSEFVWAALDCPTAYASSGPEGLRSMLLGRQSLRILRRPSSLSRCVITARRTGREGRKNFAEALLLNEFGQRLAECRALWIEVSPEVQQGVTGRPRD